MTRAFSPLLAVVLGVILGLSHGQSCKSVNYAMVVQYSDNTCTSVASGFGVPLSGSCVPIAGGLYAKADFLAASDTTKSAITNSNMGTADFPMGIQNLASGMSPFFLFPFDDFPS